MSGTLGWECVVQIASLYRTIARKQQEEHQFANAFVRDRGKALIRPEFLTCLSHWNLPQCASFYPLLTRRIPYMRKRLTPLKATAISDNKHKYATSPSL